jgi:hypothetical protein
LDKGIKALDKGLKAEKIVYKTTTEGMERFGNMLRIDSMRAGVALTRITLIPFTRVLMNLMRQGFKRVPNPLATVWAFSRIARYTARERGQSNPEIADAISTMGSQILSWSLAAALYQMFEGDEDDRSKPILITGSMPKFGAGAQENKDAAMREGMGPYRIRINLGKYSKTFEYGRIDPLALTLGTTVDLVREGKKLVRREKTTWEAGTTLLADTIVGQMTDKTMLRGMNDTFMMMSGKFDPKQWAARQLATMIVPNILRQPLRDSNSYYDASVHHGSMEDLAKAFVYELYPNAEDKLGGLIPANKFAPPASRDAYGEKEKRPDSGNPVADWIVRPQPYTPNRFDNIVRRERRENPGRDDITMPGNLSKTYTYTNPLTKEKEKHKLVGSQYEILQNLYRSIWRSERASVTGDAASLKKASDKARDLAWEIAKKSPRFQIEAKKQSDRNKKRP